MLNNKGFTVVELIMSFAFVSVLAASLFAVVVNYKEKEQDSSIKADLLSFKSKLIIDVQKDIQTKILEDIIYCRDASGNRINKCIQLNFKNGESKKFEVKETTKEDTVEVVVGGEKQTQTFSYLIPYIVYGEIVYTPPDAGNLELENSYLLNYSTPDDGVEGGITLYKISVKFKHVDLDADIDISIVATGNKFINDSSATQYGEYCIGDRVKIQLGAKEERYFHVLKASGTYENKLILLADERIYVSTNAGGTENSIVYDNPGSGIVASNTAYGNVANDLGHLKNSFDWKNPDIIRLPSAEEIGYLVYACPKYQQPGADNNLVIKDAPEWVYNTGNYWTSTPKLFVDESLNGEKMWYVNTGNKTLDSASMDSSDVASIRPVIEIGKEFVLEHDSVCGTSTGPSSGPINVNYLWNEIEKDAADNSDINLDFNLSNYRNDEVQGMNFFETEEKTNFVSNAYNNLASSSETIKVEPVIQYFLDYDTGVYIRYGTEDKQFPIYYYRGDITDNNVVFANFCWQIVRTTETGGIKLLYNGVAMDGKCNVVGSSTSIGANVFNTSADDNAHVGYMYGTAGASNYADTHANTNSSTIKSYIDDWYRNNIYGTKYALLLEDTAWCNEKTVSSGDGYGSSVTDYYWKNYFENRLVVEGAGNQYSSLAVSCSNKSDSYTVNDTTRGNGKLTYPIGLLTASEVNIAGLVYIGESPRNYLNTGESYYLMTPGDFYGNASSVFAVTPNGTIESTSVSIEMGVRPAISLVHDVSYYVGGDGTLDNPYVIYAE